MKYSPKKHQDKQGQTDLRKYAVVLGSGPSAIATIHGLLNNCEKVFVLDASVTDSTYKYVDKNYEVDRSSSPKFKNPKKSHVYKSFDQKCDIVAQNFQPTGSLAKGGLSNLWGGGFLPYDRRDLSEFPYSWDRIKGVYNNIFQILKSKTLPQELMLSLERDSEDDLKQNAYEISDTLVAVNAEQPADAACQLSSCGLGCVNCNRGIFNASFELDQLIEQAKVVFIPNIYIDKIERIDDRYSIHGIDLLNNQNREFMADAVFCCLGVLSTTKIVMDMIDPKAKLPLLSTPGGQFVAISFEKKEKEPGSSIMAGKTIILGRSDSSIVNLFPLTENLLAVMIGNTLAKILFQLFGTLLLSRVLVGNMYFSSRYSCNTIRLENSRLHLKGNLSSELAEKFSQTLTHLKTCLKLEKILKLPLLHKLLKPGQDVHYGGTLPMKSHPTELQCDTKGKLFGHENFYIADPSCMPFLHAKGHTFNSMAQSYLIGKGFESSTKKFASSMKD